MIKTTEQISLKNIGSYFILSIFVILSSSILANEDTVVSVNLPSSVELAFSDSQPSLNRFSQLELLI